MIGVDPGTRQRARSNRATRSVDIGYCYNLELIVRLVCREMS